MPDALRLFPLDTELKLQLAGVRDRVNDLGVSLFLYTEDQDFDPEKEAIGAYSQPTFPGYAAVDLEDEWTLPVRDLAGYWSIQTEVYTFTVADMGQPPEQTQTVHGAGITFDNRALFAGRLPNPVDMSLITDPLRIRLIMSQIAAQTFQLLFCV